MVNVVTNARKVAGIFAGRAVRWREAVARGVRKATVAVERAAAKRLTGKGEPMSYPIPVRTGYLRRSLGVRVLETEGMVFNVAEYAWAIHEGRKDIPKLNKRRPFLEDALRDANPGLVIQAEVRGAL
jgi:hypothetical protein